MSEPKGCGADWTEERHHREPKGAGADWTEERHHREPKGAGADWTEERHPREPKGAGADWTEERRRSDEGRRRLERRPEASGKIERAGGRATS